MASFPLQFLLFDEEPAVGQAACAVAEDVARPSTQSRELADGDAEAEPSVRAEEESAAPLEELHPALWRAHQLGRQQQGTTSSGHASLDLALPGQGWPHRALTELLLPHPGIGELRLLAPTLAGVQRHTERPVMLFDAPAQPCAATCQALGLVLHQLVLVTSRPPRPGAAAAHARLRQRLPVSADLLWTLEQTLVSGHAGAVLAWLPPTLGIDAMRRLQLAAQAHDGPAFMLRDASARLRPSIAPLRIELMPAPPDALALRVLKRRGPPLTQPLRIELARVLTGPARERSRRAAAVSPASAKRRPVPGIKAA